MRAQIWKSAHFLRVQELLMPATIPCPRDRQPINNLSELGHLPVRQLCRLTVLNDALLPGSPRDRNGPLVTHPAKSYLRRGHALALRNFLNRFDEPEVLLKDFGLEAGQHAAEIVLRQVVQGADLARQPAAADGTIRHNGDANYKLVSNAVFGNVVEVYVRSWQVSTMPLLSGSGVKRLSSISTAEMGCTA